MYYSFVFCSLFSAINTQTASYSSKNSKIFQKLGIQEPPKAPINGFLRFIAEVRPSLKNSVKSNSEITVKASEQWKQLSDGQKQKYVQAYEKEHVSD